MFIFSKVADRLNYWYGDIVSSSFELNDIPQLIMTTLMHTMNVSVLASQSSLLCWFSSSSNQEAGFLLLKNIRLNTFTPANYYQCECTYFP